MSKKLPLSDFRAVRSMLEPREFAISEGRDVKPSDLIEQSVWDGIMHLPEDVSIRTSDHNGTRFRLLHSLWSDWITAIGDDPDKPDEMYNCMLDAADCFQCANFNFLHGYYRAAIAELRAALELAMFGAYGSLRPTDEQYLNWKKGVGELRFTKCRKYLSGVLRKGDAKWMFEDSEFLAANYQKLCSFTHSRPDASDSALWKSNGPVYNNEAVRTTFFTTLSVFAICYLLVRVARRSFGIPEDSDILFELDWMPDHVKLVRAFTELYGRAPRSHATE
jgi:hypothetical protein